MSLWERIAGPAEQAPPESILSKLCGLLGSAMGVQSATAAAPASVPSGARNSPDAEEAQDKPRNPPVGPQVQVAFTIAVVALGAKMAKSDGRVAREEVAAFKQVFTVAPEDIAHVARVFDLARQDIAGYEAYADQMAKLLKGNTTLLKDVFEGLFHIATADGVLHPAEDQFLAEVARRFGFSDSEYSFIRAHFVESEDGDPLHILSLEPSATNDQIRAQYRRLVNENHPDRSMARGLPKEAIAIANRKLAAINAAYGVIARERGLK